jgi:hypothetical protein
MNESNNDIVAVASNWEPLAFHRRRGGATINDEEEYLYFHSEEVVERLKNLGVTIVAWHGYKGFGINHERAEWEHLKPFRRLIEKAGIEMGAYLQCGTYFAETFYQEVPEAREWTALDYWGKPQLYSEYYRSYYRHRPDQTYRAFSEYVSRVAQILINEYGVRYFNADNNAQMPSYTPHFEKAFRQFLKEKYKTNTPEGLALFIKRYGFPDVDHIILPCATPRMPLETLISLPDPGLQDWVEFRCRLVAQNSEIITAGAKAANPKVRISYNISYDFGEFHQMVWGTEAEFIAPHADFLYSEDSNQPRVTEDGRLISRVHTCRHLRAMGKRGNFDGGGVFGVLELAVLNQGGLGTVYGRPFNYSEKDPKPSTIRFIQQYKEVFTQNEGVSQIAVLRGRHSSHLYWLHTTEARLLTQQALFQAGLQWDNVIETTLDNLSRYQLLILPDTMSVPESCLKQIAAYVHGAGRLLVVGQALSHDEWGRGRPRSVGAVGISGSGESSSNFGRAVKGNYDKAIIAAWLGLGQKDEERIFTFPRLLHPHPYVWDAGSSDRPILDSSYHALPLNNNDFIARVVEALPEPPIVEFTSGNHSPYVIPTLLRSLRDGSISLHLLNYKTDEKVAAQTLRLRLPKNAQVKRAKPISPDHERMEDLHLEQGDGFVTIELPSFQRYLGVIL